MLTGNNDGHKLPERKITMHAIEYDGAAPNPAAPWLARTDDGAEWHTTDEAKAALQLAAWIMRRQQQDAQVQAGPALPEGAVLI